jgi:hypothetical protein
MRESWKRIVAFKNPNTFFGRFVCHFALGYSACLVAQLIAYAVGRWDVLMAAIGSLLLSALFGLTRAAIVQPGTRFWGPVFAGRQ